MITFLTEILELAVAGVVLASALHGLKNISFRKAALCTYHCVELDGEKSVKFVGVTEKADQ